MEKSKGASLGTKNTSYSALNKLFQPLTKNSSSSEQESEISKISKNLTTSESDAGWITTPSSSKSKASKGNLKESNSGSSNSNNPNVSVKNNNKTKRKSNSPAANDIHGAKKSLKSVESPLTPFLQNNHQKSTPSSSSV
jgi:hypothetical protein